MHVRRYRMPSLCEAKLDRSTKSIDLIEVAYAFGVGLATRKTNATGFV